MKRRKFTQTLCIFYLVPHIFVQASENSSLESVIEKISVVSTTRINPLNDVLTVDNTLIFPEQTLTNNRTVGDVITQTAGIELNGQGGLFQSYNVRGFSRDRIKTEVNGIPIITDRRAGNSASFIPTALINSVYVQKGPSSSLYGSGAMGGVVSLSTLGDNNLLSTSIQSNAYEITAQYTNEYINAGAVYRKANNAISPEGITLNSKYQQAAFTLSGDYLWKDIQINASTIFSDGHDIGKSSITYPDALISFYPKDSHWLSQIQLADDSTWKLQFFQHQQAWYSDVARINQADFQRQNLTEYSSNTYGLHATYALHDTKFGVDWNTRQKINIGEQEFDENNTLQWRKTLVLAKEKNVGIYVNHMWLFKQLKINAGARFDYVSLAPELESLNETSRIMVTQHKIDKQAFSASLNGMFQLTHSTQLNAEIASSFRFPTVSELLFSGETPRGTTLGNAALAAEESVGYQLSVSHRFSAELQISLSTYLYDIDNYIERFSIDSTTRTYKNTDNVTIKGVEVTTSWQPNDQFNTSIGLQWQQGKNGYNQTVDDGLPSAIKWAAVWSPEFKPLSGASLNSALTYRVNRGRAGPSETLLSKALLWNLALHYKLLKRVELSLSVINVLNENYKASADEDASFQPERMGSIQLKWFY